MTPTDLQTLKTNVDEVVRITCQDGEIILAKVLYVFDEEEDFAYDLIQTNMAHKYPKDDVQPAYVLSFSDVLSVTAMTQ